MENNKRKRIDLITGSETINILQPLLPLSISGANNQQELVYAIISENKQFYSKSELLQIIEKLINFISPTFKEECPYIG